MIEADSLQPLSKAPVQVLVSNTAQVVDLLEWVLQQCGEADILLSSFSISEEFLRRLFIIRSRYNVGNIKLILDLKATNKTARIWHFMRNVVPDARLAENHSKAVVVLPKSGEPVAIITSQNLTRGNRYEAAVITSMLPVVWGLHMKLLDIYEHKSISIHDFIRGSAEIN